MYKSIMTRKESVILVNFMFYLLTVTFVCATLLFFALLGFGHSLPRSFILSLAIGVSLPTTLFVLFITIYSLVASETNAFFHKHSLPLIGLEKSSFAIVNLQIKFFTFLRNASIVTAIFYVLSLLPISNSIAFIPILLKITLMSSILLVIGVMAIDGIYIYSRCLFEIILQFFKDKHLNTLLKSKFNNILTFFDRIRAELAYEPKHLKQQPSVSDFISSLTYSIAKRRKRLYIHKPI